MKNTLIESSKSKHLARSILLDYFINAYDYYFLKYVAAHQISVEFSSITIGGIVVVIVVVVIIVVVIVVVVIIDVVIVVDIYYEIYC